MPFLAKYMTSMLDYFDYEEVLEISNDECIKLVDSGRNFILALQPHGVISFCSLCLWVNAPPELRGMQTAVASALLKTPILKNVMGIYGLTDASSRNVRNTLRNGKGIKGCLVIYVGGLAELFKTSQEEERLYLKKRKGFIKIAMREGVDVIPVYLFGNTSVLSVLKTGILESMSRKMQLSVTYFWGKFFLPIPRDEKLLVVRGKPLGLPHIKDPTDADIDKWHAKYVDEVTRLFNQNKEKLPAYKHKKLYID
jgi:2-acylglycerol O-acyltransferase 2